MPIEVAAHHVEIESVRRLFELPCGHHGILLHRFTIQLRPLLAGFPTSIRRNARRLDFGDADVALSRPPNTVLADS
jgi:hypothetical protein